MSTEVEFGESGFLVLRDSMVKSGWISFVANENQGSQKYLGNRLIVEVIEFPEQFIEMLFGPVG